MAVGGRTVDVGALLDEGPWSGFQKQVLACAALAVVLDGFDNQALGFALPMLIAEWGVAKGDFASVLAVGLLGMALGTAIGGFAGDRVGRRRALVGSMFVFGAMTAGIALVTGLSGLMALRFLAALGLGGCLPNATTLAAEYTPARHRPWAVTATILCVPLGGMVGGLLAGVLLPSLGWRALFAVGGVAPLILGGVFAVVVPESPRYLAREPSREGELRQVLARMGRPQEGATTLVDRGEAQGGSGAGGKDRSRLRALFGGAYLRDTLGLWLAFFSCYVAVYVVFSWVPTLLVGQGMSLKAASSGLTAYNLGGVLGALAGGWAIGRVGSRPAMLAMAMGGVVSAVALKLVPLTGSEGSLALLLWLALHGAFVNAAQSTLFALAAHVYPTGVRATGSGCAIGVGRLGAVLSSYVGALVLDADGGSGYFTLIAGAMLVTCAALAGIVRHIPRAEAKARLAAATASPES
ncbi:4-hydroxybenzoate transporter [Chondromyces crocatus]|uniref:4-hydroxybenzoate transporter n=2 Tax=Chondromyces crocatus TaxID=52 RepID=A0A0K1ES68_CHOCO|nr:4-hydroxybenzoate transporter [Chondromyces crocatus]